MQFTLVTPEKTLYQNDDVRQVSIPTTEGVITVLPGHMPIVSALAAGEIVVGTKEGETPLVISGGVVEVNQKKVTVLASTAERAHEIDIERAEEARKRAEELLAQKQTAREEFALLATKLEKELARLKVGRKYKNIKP